MEDDLFECADDEVVMIEIAAVERGRTECVRLLLEAGADMEAKNMVCDIRLRSDFCHAILLCFYPISR